MFGMASTQTKLKEGQLLNLLQTTKMKLVEALPQLITLVTFLVIFFVDLPDPFS